MIGIFLLALVLHASATILNDLQECEFCTKNAVNCVVGHTLQNRCLLCSCLEDRIYHCETLTPPCDENEDNVILGKSTKARCEPHVIYSRGLVTCMCSKDGYWPHDKCEHIFYTLRDLKPPSSSQIVNNSDISSHNHYDVTKTYNTPNKDALDNILSDKDTFTNDETYSKNVSLSHDGSRSRSEGRIDNASEVNEQLDAEKSCKPNSFIIQACNVCRCNSRGVIEQCTHNDCTKTANRRTISDEHGSCEPGMWYSLAPCQFCYCQQTNKLVCSTGFTENSSLLELGSYNLSVCGKDLMKEASELVLDGKDALRVGTTTVTQAPLGVYGTEEVTQMNHFDNPPESESSEEQPEVITQEYYPQQTPTESNPQPQESLKLLRESILPLHGKHEPSVAEKEESEEQNEEANGNYIASQSSNSSHHSAHFHTTAPKSQRIPKPSVRGSEDVTAEQDVLTGEPVVHINLPTMLDRIIQMAVRKSMVKVQSTSTCTPGSTTISDCNHCFCLTNGKLLCTASKCNETAIAPPNSESIPL